MSGERAGAGTAGNGLQRWCFNLGVAGFVEHAAYGANHGGALQEGVLHAVVHNEVDVALAIAQLGVFKSVVGHAVLLLYDRQRTQRFAEHGQSLGVNRYFAGLGAEHKTRYAHKVADVEQFLEHHVIEVLVFVGTKLVAVNIHLNAALAVLNFHKRSLAHNAAAHHASGNAHLAWLGVVAEGFLHLGGVSVHLVFGCRIRVDAHIAQLVQTVTSDDFLFA